MVSKALFTSDSDEWATPKDFFDRLDAEFNFTLDPCATDENHKCPQYFTKEDDGLGKDWGGRECFATHLTVKYLNGLKKLFMRPEKTIRLLCCLYLQGQILNIFTTIFYIEPKYVLLKDV